MLKIKFEYCDEMSNGEWREQECIVSSVEECKIIYGLGIDCDYRIISVEECKRIYGLGIDCDYRIISVEEL